MSTTNRDRVEAALAEFVRWGKHGTDREMMAAALAAALAAADIAPPTGRRVKLIDGRFEPIADAPAVPPHAPPAEQRIAELERVLRRTDSALERAALYLHDCVEAREAVETERDEARVAQAKHNVQRMLAESRLSQARADALEEAVKVAGLFAQEYIAKRDDMCTADNGNAALTHARQAQACYEISDAIRALADSEPAGRSLASIRADALEEAARIAEEQPYYFDTHNGKRQQWAKDEIARKIRSLTDGGPAVEARSNALEDTLAEIMWSVPVHERGEAWYRACKLLNGKVLACTLINESRKE